MMLRELLLEVFYPSPSLAVLTWVTLSRICALCVYCDPYWVAPSVLAVIWDWLLLNTFDYSLLIVLDVNFFISALGFKTVVVVVVVVVFPSSSPTSVSQIQLHELGKWSKTSFLLLMETEFKSFISRLGNWIPDRKVSQGYCVIVITNPGSVVHLKVMTSGCKRNNRC